jgi:hypothetical protein
MAAGSDPSPPAPGETPPLLRVLKGDPSPEELAALVAVVSALAAGAAETASRRQRGPRSEWSARHRLLRRPHRHGPGVWRSSAR